MQAPELGSLKYPEAQVKQSGVGLSHDSQAQSHLPQCPANPK